MYVHVVYSCHVCTFCMYVYNVCTYVMYVAMSVYVSMNAYYVCMVCNVCI